MTESPRVSVLIITYNHERFIEHALASALDQATSFPYEIVVGEDASSDRTRELVADLQRRHPERVVLLPDAGRLGMQRNFARTLAACQGDYVALLEGDDYWISPHKLERQAAFLDAYRECVLCFHDVIFMQAGAAPKTWPKLDVPRFTIDDLLTGNFIPTCSVMCRRVHASHPEWTHSLPMGDWPFTILLGQHGSYGYVGESLAVYRKHGAGVYSGSVPVERLAKVPAMFDLLEQHLPRTHLDAIRRGRARALQALATGYEDSGDPVRAGEVARAYRRASGLKERLLTRAVWELRGRAPSVYRLLRSIRGMISPGGLSR